MLLPSTTENPIPVRRGSVKRWYFLSDVHLRPDRPERDRRLVRFAGRLTPDDRLFILGDLCDFWFTARHRRGETTAALEQLARFVARGGELTIVAGNHDDALSDFYRRRLGARVVPDRWEGCLAGRWFHLTHGHRIRSSRWWKPLLETRAFLAGFRLLPRPLAAACDRCLLRFNQEAPPTADSPLHQAYRAYVRRLQPPADVVVLGHSHFPLDETHQGVRMIVLDCWYDRANWLTWDGQDLDWTVEPDDPVPAPAGGG